MSTKSRFRSTQKPYVLDSYGVNKSRSINPGWLLGLFLLLAGAVFWYFSSFTIDRIESNDTKIPVGQNGNSPCVGTEKGAVIKDDLIQPKSLYLPVLSKVKRLSDRIRSGESLSTALIRHGISPKEIHEVASSLRKKINLRQIQPGDVYVMETHLTPESTKGLSAFELIKTDPYGAPTRFRAARHATSADLNNNGKFKVSKIETPIVVESDVLGGKIKNSLYESMVEAGGDPVLVNRFADVFGWQIDFYSEAQKGDKFTVLVEKKFADGIFVGYGHVLAAEYESTRKKHLGYYFRSKDGKVVGIFDDKGKSLEKTFLKSPVELARITSKFGQRFHPILKRKKKHDGVDYGASMGTPFWAVADGVVINAGYTRFNGNWVRVRHKYGYITEYLHAKKLAPGIRPGVKVKQRQVIGYVGATGLANGPHLHFGMKKYNKYVNPVRQKFPAGKAVPKKILAEYFKEIKPLEDRLKKIGI